MVVADVVVARAAGRGFVGRNTDGTNECPRIEVRGKLVRGSIPDRLPASGVRFVGAGRCDGTPLIRLGLVASPTASHAWA